MPQLTNQPIAHLCQSVAETLALGEQLGRLALPGQVLALDGPLGAGKTQLVRGIATGAGVADVGLVNSPSYVLLNIYPAATPQPSGKTIYHLDAYRAGNAAAFAAVGWEELLEQDALVILEWAAKVPELLPADYLHLQAALVSATARRWTATAHGEQSIQLLKTLFHL